ncbi:MAG TPA: permease-like cell division protein FtsX [Candidatus Binatia bacterium]|nr:permease-like cell division protein FtsX [Candidatus Binatia bacterium]
MKGSQLSLVGRRVCNSLWERLWTHVLTAGTMAMALFVFSVFMLVQENLQNLLAGWGNQIQINAYLDKTLGVGEVSLLHDKVQSFPEVERVRHISREQAWKDFRVALGVHSNVLDGLPEDVLPASFEIFVKPAYRDGPIVEALANRLRKEKGVATVEYPQEWVDRLSLVVLALQWAKWVLGGILFIAVFFIIRSTVGLAILAQRDEIEVMQLVGATEELIQAPFVIEGLIQGFIGAGLSVLGLWFLVLFLRDQIMTSIGLFGSLGQLQFIDWRSIVLILAIGSLLGASGSVFSLRRFMKRWKG